MNRTTRIALLAAAALLPYSVGAFAQWELNPAFWPLEARTGVAAGAAWCVALAALYLGTRK